MDHSISACYYPLDNIDTPYPLEWYLTTPATVCYNHSQLSFVDEYASAGRHTWEGLDDNFQTNFTASFLGYLEIAEAGEYRFKILASTGFRLYIEDMTIPLLSAFSPSSPVIELESEGVWLSEGKHPFVLLYLNGWETAQLHVYYSFSSSNSINGPANGNASATSSQLKWKTVDSTMLIAGGISPQHLVVQDILSFRGHYIVSKAPKFSAGLCTSYSLSSSLPLNLYLNTVTGVIYGLLYSPVVEEQYELCCSAASGRVCAPFKLLCTYTPLAGLTARFYEINNTTDICANPSVVKDHLDLLLEHVVESISYTDMCALDVLCNTVDRVCRLFLMSYTTSSLRPGKGSSSRVSLEIIISGLNISVAFASGSMICCLEMSGAVASPPKISISRVTFTMASMSRSESNSFLP